MTEASAMSISATASLDHGRLRRRIWPLLALTLLVAWIYWPGLTGGYVFDDYPNIVNNTAVHVAGNATWNQWLAAMFSSPSSELQRPLAMLSFAINHAITGLNPYWMKLTNLGIHLLNSCLVFGLVRRILLATEARDPVQHSVHKDWVALWVAAAWALNPINLTAVLFVVQRMESLSHTFVFAGLWVYLAGRAHLSATGHGWTALLTGLMACTALGLLAKESAVLLPLYALALEWTLLRFASHHQLVDGRLLTFFALVLALPTALGTAWLLPRTVGAMAYASRDFNLTERLLTEGRVLLDYLHWTILPDISQLSLYHDDYSVSQGLLSPPKTLFSLLFLSFLLVAMVWLRRRRPLMALGLAWFFAAHALTATVIPLELMHEHRNYFASLGLMLLLADGLLRAPLQRWRRLAITTAALVFALYASLTALRVNEWRDPVSFSLIEASKHPQSPRATYDIARNLIILSDYQPNSPYTEKAYEALDRAMRVPNATALPEAAAITLAARTGRPIQISWWESLQHKLRTRPVGPQEAGALATLVDCQIQQQCSLPPEQMSESFSAALAHGANAEVLNIYGNYVLNIRNDPSQALILWRKAAQMAPHTVQYQVTLARMLIATGQLDEAAVQIARIRGIGRMGQNAAVADDLQRLAAQARTIDHPPSQTTDRE